MTIWRLAAALVPMVLLIVLLGACIGPSARTTDAPDSTRSEGNAADRVVAEAAESALTAANPRQSTSGQSDPRTNLDDADQGSVQSEVGPASLDRAPRAGVAPKHGIHLLLGDGWRDWPQSVWPEHVGYARRLVGEGGYVVQLIESDNLGIKRWQAFLDLCAEERVTPVFRLATVYDRERQMWLAPTKDPDGEGYTVAAARYRRFFSRLRWPTSERYVIVGNEPNRGDEWENRPDPAEYARYLVDVGEVLHELGFSVLGPSLDTYAPNSNGQVVGGYRYVDAETFIDEMAAVRPGAFGVIDVWSSHSYPMGPFQFDPSRQSYQVDYLFGATNPRHVDPPPGVYNRGINSYEWELWKLGQYVGDRASSIPVMITETGWRHASSVLAESSDSANSDLPDELVGAYVDLAFNGNGGRYPGLPSTGWTPWNDDPRVVAVILFALDGSPRFWGHTNWLRVTSSGQIVGEYPAYDLVSQWAR